MPEPVEPTIVRHRTNGAGDGEWMTMRQIGEEELDEAASVLVKTVLRIAEGERFVIVGDQDSQPIAAALEKAGRAAAAEVAALRIDQLRSVSTNHSGERPHKVLPDAVRRAMLSTQASAFVASAPHQESSMREQLVHVVGACKVRHAQMAGITKTSFAAGFAVDYEKVAEWGRALERRLEVAREITAESADGTHLVVRPPASRRWISRLGKVGPGEAVVFPAGSLIACPDSVSGTFAATAVGEFFGAREGLLAEPVVFEIVEGRVIQVDAPGCPPLVRDIDQMLRVAPNSDRIGLVVLGVNAGAPAPTGEVAVDQHRPGLHLVVGDPLAKLTGASWSARTSFAACQGRGTVRIDGVCVIDDGKLVI
jgi:leucyl aminopeptidase (aminopeptidase T)